MRHPEKGRYAKLQEVPCRRPDCKKCWDRIYSAYVRFYEEKMPVVVYAGLFAHTRRDAFRVQANSRGALRVSIPVELEQGTDEDSAAMLVGITDVPVNGYTERPVDSVAFLRSVLPFYRTGRNYRIDGSRQWKGARKQAQVDDGLLSASLPSEPIERTRLGGSFRRGITFAVEDAVTSRLKAALREENQDFDLLPLLQRNQLIDQKRNGMPQAERKRLEKEERQRLLAAGGLDGHTLMRGEGLELPDDLIGQVEALTPLGFLPGEVLKAAPKPGNWRPTRSDEA